MADDKNLRSSLRWCVITKVYCYVFGVALPIGALLQFLPDGGARTAFSKIAGAILFLLADAGFWWGAWASSRKEAALRRALEAYAGGSSGTDHEVL